MTDDVRYWKCPECHGVGKRIRYWTTPASVEPCPKCDGTGNALVDGEARRYAREVERIERESAATQ